jgi:hypothetical protein
MKKLIVLSAVLVALLTLVSCAAGPRMIDSLGLWSLEKLGYSDLIFPDKEPLEATSIKYILPESAAQGPENWYVIYLHFSIEFSDESDDGSVYVSASTNGRTAAQVKFVIEKHQDDSLTIDWITGSENLIKGDVKQSTSSLSIEDIHFANYLQTSGVKPGLNVLTFKLEQYDGAKVRSLQIFSDSGIALTLHPPSRF